MQIQQLHLIFQVQLQQYPLPYELMEEYFYGM